MFTRTYADKAGAPRWSWPQDRAAARRTSSSTARRSQPSARTRTDHRPGDRVHGGAHRGQARARSSTRPPPGTQVHALPGRPGRPGTPGAARQRKRARRRLHGRARTARPGARRRVDLGLRGSHPAPRPARAPDAIGGLHAPAIWSWKDSYTSALVMTDGLVEAERPAPATGHSEAALRPSQVSRTPLPVRAELRPCALAGRARRLPAAKAALEQARHRLGAHSCRTRGPASNSPTAPRCAAVLRGLADARLRRAPRPAAQTGRAASLDATQHLFPEV